MSAVLDKNKKRYTKVFMVESALILVIYALFYLLKPTVSLSFLLGALAAFLPQVVFAGYVFYLRAGSPPVEKAKILYQGEAIKITVMIVLLLLIFINIKLNPIIFFAGYFGLILLNNLLPFVLSPDSASRKN